MCYMAAGAQPRCQYVLPQPQTRSISADSADLRLTTTTTTRQTLVNAQSAWVVSLGAVGTNLLKTVPSYLCRSLDLIDRHRASHFITDHKQCNARWALRSRYKFHTFGRNIPIQEVGSVAHVLNKFRLSRIGNFVHHDCTSPLQRHKCVGLSANLPHNH